MMTLYEIAYLRAFPFLPVLLSTIRQKVTSAVKPYNGRPHLLDVGGRRSPYTIGVPADVTILDLPRESDDHDLGITGEIVTAVTKRRSNIKEMVFDDMTKTTLPDNSFDLILAVEVIEHVEHDQAFMAQVHRVLKPGGTFILSTQNADHPTRKKPTDPKDFRFYTRQQMVDLLSDFAEVQVDYAVPVGKHFSYGLKSWSLTKPKQTLQSMWGNWINHRQAADPQLKTQAQGTRYLIATARK